MKKTITRKAPPPASSSLITSRDDQKKGFKFLKQKKKKRVREGSANVGLIITTSSNDNGNDEEVGDKKYLLGQQEKTNSPMKGSLFDLADHKIYGFSFDTWNVDHDDNDDVHDDNSKKDSNNDNGDNINPLDVFHPLAHAKLKQLSPPTSPSINDNNDGVTNYNNDNGDQDNVNYDFKTKSTKSNTIRKTVTSPDEVHALNKKKRDEFLASQGRNPRPKTPLPSPRRSILPTLLPSRLESLGSGTAHSGYSDKNNVNDQDGDSKGYAIDEMLDVTNDSGSLVERPTDEDKVAQSSNDDIIIESSLSNNNDSQSSSVQKLDLKSHPGSILINNSDNESISSSIAESIELLNSMNILSMADFLKLDDAQRVHAYRTLADTAAETVTEIDEKRTEIFSMGRQVDDLSRRVTELMETKITSHKKINEYKNQIRILKESSSSNDNNERISSLTSELEAKNIIINELKKSMNTHERESPKYVSTKIMEMSQRYAHRQSDKAPVQNTANGSSVMDRVKLFERGDKIQFKVNNKETEEWNDTLQVLRTEIETKDSIIDELRRSIEENKVSPKEEDTLRELISDLRKKISEKDAALMKVTDELTLSQAKFDNVSETKSESNVEDTLTKENEKLSIQVNDLLSQLKEKDEIISNFKDEETIEREVTCEENGSKIDDLLSQIKEKDDTLEELSNTIKLLKQEDTKKTDFYQRELKSVQEKFVNKKIKELERTNLENDELTHKLEQFESICTEKEALAIRVTEMEEEILEKDKKLELLKSLDDTVAENDMLSERIKELENERQDKEKLQKRIKLLEVEIGDVSGLLEETFKSVKEINETALGVYSNDSQGSALFRLSPKRVLNNGNNKNDSSFGERKQLEKICMIHQTTVLRQKAEIDKLQEILNEKDTQLNELRLQATINEEKISALETQFIELNKAQDKKTQVIEICNHDDDGDEHSGFIKVEKAFYDSIQSQSEKDADFILELKNQIVVLKSRNEKLNEKIGLEDDLRHEIEDLTTKLQASNLIVEGLEKSYREFQEAQHETNKEGECEEASITEKKKSKPVLSLDKAIVSQELQHAAIRRFQDLVQKLSSSEHKSLTESSSSSSLSKQSNIVETKDGANSNNLSLIVSLSDKLSLLHEYLKVSLHLLECKLSNDVESLSSVSNDAKAGTDDAVAVRFEQAVESIQEIENEMKQNFDMFEKEVQHQMIKTSAKDGVIENLLKNDERLNEKIKDLQSELEVFKSLSTYSSVNVGVMTRFQQAINLEKELNEKEDEIKRLKSIIKSKVDSESITDDTNNEGETNN